MATTNQRDIELRIAATTSGAEAVRKLGDELQSLAKEGGNSAQEFKQLGDELARLGKQGDAIQALDKVGAEVEATTAKFTEAKTRAEALGEELKQQKATTAEYANVQATLRDQVRATEAALQEETSELRKLRAEYVGSAKDTKEYIDKNQALRLAVIELQDKLAQQKSAFRSAKEATAEQRTELGKLQSEYNKADTAVNRLESTLGKQNASLNAAGDALKQLGIEASGVDDALVKVEAALADVARRSEEVKAADQQLAAIQRAVAESNARNVELARKAAADRVAASRAAVQAANEQAAAEARLGYAADELAASLRKISTDAKTAGAEVDKAFGTLGVRSASAIRAELDAVRASLITLTNNANITGEDFDRAFAQAQVRTKELETELAKLPGHVERTTQGTNLLTSGFKQLVAAYVGIDLANKFVDAATQIETLRRSLTVITGSSEEASRQIALLRDAANNAGVSIGSVSQAFINFQAAMIKSGQSSEATRDIFISLTSAAGKLGLSGDKVGLMLTALGQIANKGKVSLEELQGQLGESLPGALKIAADGLGVTTSDLTKMIETGQLLAEQFLPAFGRQLQIEFGNSSEKVADFAQAWARLKNQITTTVQEVTDTSLWKGLTAVLDSTASNFKTIVDVGESLIKTFLAFKAINIVREFLGLGSAAAVVTKETLSAAAASEKNAVAAAAETAALRSNTAAVLSNAEAKRTASVIGGALATGYEKTAAAATGLIGRLGSLTAALGGPYGAALTVAIGFSEQLGNGIAWVAAKFTGLIDKIDANEKKLKEQEKTWQDAVRAAQAAGLSYTQVIVAYDKLFEAAEKNTKVLEKIAKAKTIEGESSVALAKLYGDELTIRERTSSAALANVDAAQKVAAAANEEASILMRKRTEMVNAAGGYDRLTTAQKEQITTLTQLIDKKKADADVAVQNAEKLRVESAEAKINAQIAQDNSSRLEQLSNTRTIAAATLARYTELERLGLVVGTDLNGMKRNLAEAERLYKDALADSVRNIELKNKATQADTAVTKASLDVKMAAAKADEQAAVAAGDETRAIDARVAQKRIEIEIVRLSRDAKIAEANSAIEALKVERETITGLDDASEARRRQIDISIKLQEAKIKEAGASDAVVKGLKAEIDAMNRKAVAVTNLASANSAAAKIGPNDIAVDANGRTEYQRNLMSQQGGPVDNSYVFQLRDRLNRGDTFAASELPAIENALRVAKENARVTTGSSVQSLAGIRDATAWVNTLQQIRDRAAMNASAESMLSTPAASAASGVTQTTQAVSSSTAGTTINLTLNGTTRAINVAGSADANNLIEVLKQLGYSASTAGPGA